MRQPHRAIVAVSLALLQAPCCVPSAFSLAPAPALQTLTFPQWQNKLASYRGEIVLVEFWATWCAPCIERFPKIVTLHSRYRPKGVRVVSMNLDDRTDPIALNRAQEFLVRQKADFENYRLDLEVPDAFEKLDLLGIPVVLVYDRTGKLRHKLTGDNPNRQYKDQDVVLAIENVLNARN